MTNELNDNLSMNDFIPEEEGFELPDPNSVITFLTSGGQAAYVPVAESITIGQALLESDLRIMGSVQYWLNGALVDVNTVVSGGSTVTIVGSVKGG